MIAYFIRDVWAESHFPLYFRDLSQNAELLLVSKKTFNMKEINTNNKG